MNDDYDDHQIAKDFSRLRQVELGQAPQFASLLGDPAGTRPRHGPLRPSAGFAVAVLTLSILAIVLLRPDTQGGATDSRNDPGYFTDAIQLSAVDTMPTDFLLDTPWPQLASLQPETQLPYLPYDFLEEQPNEP